MLPSKNILAIFILAIFTACDLPQFNNDQPNPDEENKIKTIDITAGISSQAVEWEFSKATDITIPSYKIDSIILSVPLRSVQEYPNAEAILLDLDANKFIYSSKVTSIVRYTIDNRRSLDLKGYFTTGNYRVKIGLRSADASNYVEIPYDSKLIIYYK